MFDFIIWRDPKSVTIFNNINELFVNTLYKTHGIENLKIPSKEK
jgi:hypothetical protein